MNLVFQTTSVSWKYLKFFDCFNFKTFQELGIWSSKKTKCGIYLWSTPHVTLLPMSCRFLLERISYQNNSWTFPNAQDFVRISYKTTHRTFVFCVPTTNPPHFDPTFVPKPKELLPVDPSALRATRLWHLPRRAGGWRCHDSSSVAATENAHDSLPDAKGSHHHLSGAAMAFCCWVNTTLTWWQFSLPLVGSYYSWRALKTTLLTWAGFRDLSIPEKVWLEH